jgi:mannose-6-phosphate isomerase-like protein (cupin superfamily)
VAGIGVVSSQQASGYVVQPGAGLAGQGGLLASRTSTGGTFTLMESHAKGGAPPHVHEREDEAMYVLEGQITVHVGNETFVVAKHGFVFMPHGVLHDWDVDSGTARVLILAAPGGLEEFLGEFHAAADWDERDSIAERYGLRFPH